MRVGLVHEWLTTWGGSEQVLEAIGGLFPEAPIHTLLYQPKRFKDTGIARHPIRPSFIQKLPLARSHHRWFLPLMPVAIERFDLSDFHVVISSSHTVAKGVLTGADQLHISYVHTPIRYAWDLRTQYLRESRLERGARGLVAECLLHCLRLWDVASSNRVDVYVANSKYVARRIWKTYRRRAWVIHPPVDVSRFHARAERDGFYLIVSRLVPYKRVDLIVAAFNTLRLPLVVIGDGPLRSRLERLAGPTIRLLGWQPDDVVAEHMQRCRAFVVAGVEDFGIASVEAQAAGAPVIAYGRGGVRETVLPSRTGLFFEEQNVASLARAVGIMEQNGRTWDCSAIRLHAEQFSRERFQATFAELVEHTWRRFQQGSPIEPATPPIPKGKARPQRSRRIHDRVSTPERTPLVCDS